MKYLGSFTYFATGEGYRDYYLLLSADSEEEALEKFVIKTANKWYSEGHEAILGNKGIEFCRYGCKVKEISSVVLDDLNEPIRPLIESVQRMCGMNGMIDGDFEYWFQYNLS